MINEINSKSFENIDNKNQFNPDKRMEINKDETDNIASFNPDKRLEKNDYFSTYNERIAQTPKEGWDGKRGESLCRSNNEEVNNELSKFGQDGVSYKNGLADVGFKKCSVEKVDIDMTERRYGPNGNMEKARTALANKWNDQKKDGRIDWNAREVHKYQQENKLVIHECANRRTCYLMPIVIHEEFSHLGGVSECKKVNEKLGIRKEVKFDE